MNNSIKRIALICCALLLGSCSNGTSFLDLNEPGGSGGGIGGSGIISYSVGTLTGFGSVYINGNRFDTSSAEFSVNGQAANQSQLQVGMQLSAQVNFDDAAARQVDYTATLIGTVQSPPDANGMLQVMNQNIHISPSTVLDGLISADLIAGRAIEVSGVTDANNLLVASYVRLAPSTELQLAGIVSAISDDQQTLSVRNITVSLGQAELSGLGDVSLTAGASIIVKATQGQFDAATSTITASSIIKGATVEPVETSRIELAGFVQSYINATSFAIDGVQIATTSLTRFETIDGISLQPSSVTLNSLIEIEGTFSTSSIVVAEKVVVLPIENTELTGRVEAINADDRTVTLFGVPIRTTSITRFRADDVDAMNFEKLRVGDYVEIAAAYTPTGLIANKVEVDDPESEASIEGPVTDIRQNQGQLQIAGVSVRFNENTDFGDDNEDNESGTGQQTFLAQVVIGTVVKAKWDDFNSIESPVDELEID